MPLQRRLLHAMLMLLGLAALAGVSTIFLPGSAFVGRVGFTLFAAAVSMAIAMPASRMLERQQKRGMGLYVLGASVGGFCLALLAIWGDYVLNRMTEPFGLSLFAYVAAAVSAGIFLSLRMRPAGLVAGTVGLAITGLGFLGGLATIWDMRLGLGLPGPKIGDTVGLLSGIVVPLCASLFGTWNDGRWWRWLGALAAAGAFGLGFYGTWIKQGGDATWFVQLIIIASAVGGVNVLLRLPLPKGQRWLACATAGVLVLTGLAASYVSAATEGFRLPGGNDLGVRLFSAGAIVTACGVLAIVVLLAFSRRMLVTEARSLAEIRAVALACPRCGRRQEVAVGESRCGGCGLIFLMKFAEPHCAKCNYSLLDLKSDVCPECGEKIDAARRNDEREA